MKARGTGLKGTTLGRRATFFYWINFAATGNPNGKGLPVWPAVADGAQDAMVFDQTPGARPLPNLDRLRAFDTFYSCAWRRRVL